MAENPSWWGCPGHRESITVETSGGRESIMVGTSRWQRVHHRGDVQTVESPSQCGRLVAELGAAVDRTSTSRKQRVVRHAARLLLSINAAQEPS